MKYIKIDCTLVTQHTCQVSTKAVGLLHITGDTHTILTADSVCDRERRNVCRSHCRQSVWQRETECVSLSLRTACVTERRNVCRSHCWPTERSNHVKELHCRIEHGAGHQSGSFGNSKLLRHSATSQQWNARHLYECHWKLNCPKWTN
jgi:hypothetical protein